MEVKFEEYVHRDVDKLGRYWQVFYRWEDRGEQFSFGSQRAYEDLLPEADHRSFVSQDLLDRIKRNLERAVDDFCKTL